MTTLHMHDKCHANDLWCGRRGSNPHSLRRWNLNPVRLPIPPRPHVVGLEGLEPQPDRYERPALTIELQAPPSAHLQPMTCASADIGTLS
jgi:hypothetical protein